MTIGALPGFRDFYPEDFAQRAYLFGAWRGVARRYALAEYDGPPLESTELYTRKSGPEIVTQLYNFVDKGEREVSLRPEMTPTLARMVAARANSLRKPVRWFSIPQLFRYERQQRGRLKEHFQLNVDIVGEPSVSADAELVACGIDVMRSVGLTSDDIVVRFSNRHWLNATLAGAGVEEPQFPGVYHVLDKLHRQTHEVSLERLAAAGLTSSTAANVLTAVEHVATVGGKGVLASLAFATLAGELRTYLDYVSALLRDDASNWMKLDLSIVRGLAYYTGIVFEIFDNKGAMRSICGGGRYDGLLAAVGGPDLPAVGFGMGDVVLLDLLKERGLVGARPRKLDVWVAAGGGESADEVNEREVRSFAGRLRQEGFIVEYPLRRQSLGRQLRTAADEGAHHAAIVHETGRAGDAVTVRNLETGEMRGPMSFDDATSLLKGQVLQQNG